MDGVVFVFDVKSIQYGSFPFAILPKVVKREVRSVKHGTENRTERRGKTALRGVGALHGYMVKLLM